MSDNPYAAPQSNVEPSGDSEQEDVRKAHISTEASIKAVGLLYLLGGALIGFSSLAMLAGAGFSGGGASMMAMSLGLLALALLQGATGWWLREFKHWARILATIESAIGLLGFPFGTLINAYILYLLWSRKGRTVFSPGYRAVVEATPHIRYKTSIVVWIFLGLILLLLAVAVVMPLVR